MPDRECAMSKDFLALHTAKCPIFGNILAIMFCLALYGIAYNLGAN